jgi:molybdate-binding protein
VQFRLGFVPVASERYFFVCRQESLGQPAIAALIDLLRGAKFREIIAALPGYSAPHAGAVSTVTDALKMSDSAGA